MGQYTNGEILALIAPMFGLDPEDICGFVIVIRSHPRHVLSVVTDLSRDHAGELCTQAARRLVSGKVS